jgi:hypothetical protein
MSSFADPYATTREAFRMAFRNYCDESAMMQKLLVSLSDQPSELRLPPIEQQQKRVSDARELYESAREDYMREVLGVIV